jgi:hypothetical protein
MVHHVKQILQIAFQLVGSVGYLLSTVPPKLLTTVWKMEVDPMSEHVVVATGALPPMRVEVAHTQLPQLIAR